MLMVPSFCGKEGGLLTYVSIHTIMIHSIGQSMRIWQRWPDRAKSAVFAHARILLIRAGANDGDRLPNHHDGGRVRVPSPHGLAGKPQFVADISCRHHGYGEGHSCGKHGANKINGILPTTGS